MIFARDCFQRIEILTVVGTFSGIPVKTLCPRHIEFGIKEWGRPIPIALKSIYALKLEQIGCGSGGRSVTKDVLAQVLLKPVVIQSGVVAEFAECITLDPREQSAIRHATISQSVH